MEIEEAYSPNENKPIEIEETRSYSPNINESKGTTNSSDEDSEFMHASNVNVFNFVSVKLSGKSNYNIWKAQMLCLLKNQKMHAIIENQSSSIEKHWSDKILRQYDNLFKGWIFASLNEKVFDRVKAYDSGSIVWETLESLYDPISSAPRGNNYLAI